MEVTETSAEGLKREFKVVVPAADIEARLNDRLGEIAKTIRMPGFRPGKVPVNLLRKTHGKAVMGEVIERTVSEGAQSALSERELRPVTEPRIEITNFEDGADLEYTIALELFPEIDIADFKTFKLERLVVPPDEEKVEETLAQFAKYHSTSKPIEEARACAAGDVVVLDFVGTVDGEEFAGGKAENYQLELGSGAFIPGFEDQLIGAKAGETREVKITFPEQYTETLAGKDAVFTVTVNEIRESIPAEIDDELAKRMGAESIEDVRKRVREDQNAETAGIARMRLKRDLLDMLNDAHDFELPPGIVDSEFEQIWHQFEHQREHHPDQIDEDDKGKSDDELKAQYREIAERRVRLGLLLAEIGRVNNVEVTAEEVNRAIATEARRFAGREKEVFDYYRNTPEAARALQAPILEEKVVDYILELADVRDREVSLDDLLKEPEPAEKKAKGGAKGKKETASAKTAAKGRAKSAKKAAGAGSKKAAKKDA